MNVILEQINSAGLKFVEFALPMFVQSVVLIFILLLADFALRKKVRAVFRYWIWLLVLLKLVLPTSLSSPMSLGYFFGNRLTYVDTTEKPAEPQANIVEISPASVPPFIDLSDIQADRFTPAAPPIIPVTDPAVTKLANVPVISVTPLSWQGAVFLTWLTVVIAMVLLLLQRAIFVRGLVAQAKEANGFMADTLESCRVSMSVKRKLSLKISANATSPAVCGLFRPVILVPQNLASSLTAGQLRAVLLHELAHIRRGDLFVNLAQTILQIIYFYNPLLWLANCIIRRIREQAVDEMVLVAMGEKATQYPQTLVSVAKLAFKRPVLSLRLIGVVESKSALSARIKHILNRPMPKKAKLGIIGLVVVIIIGAILLPMANSMPGPPKLVIKGVVKDAQTGEPIAGARVFDDGYGPEPVWEQIRPGVRCQWGAITNEAGQYSFLTWPEHHSIKVEAPGYKPKRRSLYSGHFTFNKKEQEIFDFTLEPEKAGISLPIRKVSSVENEKGGTFEWETSIEPTVRFRHGWYTVEDGVIKEYVGAGGSQIPQEGRINLKLDVELKDNMLNLKIQREEHLVDGSGTVTMASKTAVPPGVYKIEEISIGSALLTKNHLTLWQGDFIRDGKVVKSVIYAAYLTTPGDWETGFKPPVLQKTEFTTANDKSDVQVEPEGVEEKGGTTDDGIAGVVGSENDLAVTVRKASPPEGTAYFKKFDQKYLLEIVSKSFGRDIAEAVGRKSSGIGMGSAYIKKHIGFGIPFSAKGIDGLRKMRQFRRELHKTITEDIKETLGIKKAGGGGSGGLLSITYRAQSTIGTIDIFFSEKDQDITQIMFVIREVKTEKDKSDVKLEPEIDWVVEDYGQTRLLSKKEISDIDNWISIWGSVVKNKGRYLVPDRGLTLKGLIKAAGYNRDKLAQSYVELIRWDRQGNITARSTYSRNLKTLLSGEESDIVIKPHDSIGGGYIEPSANGVEFWSGYHFSDVVEMTVNDDGAKVNMFADLDTGKLVTPPDTLNNNDENTVLRWIKDNRIDVMGETASSVHGLIGFNMYAARVDNYLWDAAPLEFTDRLMIRIDDPVLLSVENLLPVTYLIKTSEYKIGILQILGFVENPKGIKIRYKLLHKEAEPKAAVQVGPEPAVGDWQFIGQAIVPDFNDTLILTEHVNLGSIGQDAEGKTFITFVRDGEKTQNRQYRFVLFNKAGNILEPDGHIVLGESKRLEEKFTFDEPFVSRRLKGFRFQARPLPPSGIDNISSQLQKPASEVFQDETLLPTDLAPPGRYAIELDGVDDYLLVPDSPSLKLEPPFTIEMWVKTKLPPDDSEYRGGWALISKGFYVGTPRAYLTGFGINLHRFPNEPSNLAIDFCKANNSGTYSATYAGYPLKDGVSDWIHITHVFEGKYYKSTPGHPLVMGKFLSPTENPLMGLLGEVRLWNGARTRQELRQYKNVALTGTEPGLAACWTFEQTKGQFAYDISGNNNHARLGSTQGPDKADPKWIDLQPPSPQPDRKTDVQVEAKQADKKRQYPVQLTWPLIQDASKYVVQIHGLRGSRPAKSFESVTNRLLLRESDIAPGRYQWSVSAYDEQGKLMNDIETIDPDEIFAIEDPEPVAKNGKKVMIDLNHSAGHMRGWGYYNHAQYMTKELLENAGFEVQVNERDLLTYSKLESVDLLICNYYWAGWPEFRPYLKSELVAVHRFVEGGGSLLVVGCDGKDGGGNMCKAGNELLRQFGLMFEPGKISKESGMAQTISQRDIISFEKPIPLQLPVGVQGGNALTLLRVEGEPIAKARQYGQGRVIAAGVGMSFLDCYLADFKNRQPLHLIMFYDFIKYLTHIDWKESCKQEFIEKISSRYQF